MTGIRTIATDGEPECGGRALIPAHGVPGRLIALLAVASGMTVANLYYAQPLLSSLREVFHTSTAAPGWLITSAM
jgi:hypothetical protein